LVSSKRHPIYNFRIINALIVYRESYLENSNFIATVPNTALSGLFGILVLAY
jgi:hypothetical protein